MRAASDFSCACILSRDSRLGCGIEWPSKTGSDGKSARTAAARSRNWQSNGEFDRINFSGRKFGDDVAENLSRCIHRQTTDRMPLAKLDLTEMKRLTAQLTAYGSSRAFVERDPNDRPGRRPSW